MKYKDLWVGALFEFDPPTYERGPWVKKDDFTHIHIVTQQPHEFHDNNATVVLDKRIQAEVGKCIYVIGLWGSQVSQDGKAIRQFVSTRSITNDDHRRQLGVAIRNAMSNYLELGYDTIPPIEWGGKMNSLLELLMFLRIAPVGIELLSARAFDMISKRLSRVPTVNQ